ncbi:MAG: hypothetical protein IJD10_06515, partial [Clostridia bacterium]|nr:hypothetical protein [Clostridia bacterium]
MYIEKCRVTRKVSAEGKGIQTVSLLLPHFTEQAEGWEGLNGFYEKVANPVCERAAALACTVVSEMRIACAEDT